MDKKVLWFLLIPGALLTYSIKLSIADESLESYFQIPFYAIINIAIAIFFAFCLNQLYTDKRKKKEIVGHLIEKIINVIADQRFSKICDENDIGFIRIEQRSIDNRIRLLGKYSKLFKYSDELGKVKMHFQNYWNTVSNHITDIDHLMKSEVDLNNHISNLTYVLEQILVKIWE